MDDLVQWFGRQLDDEERVARDVRVPPDWHQGPGDDPEWTTDEMVLMWPPEFHTPYEQDKHWRGLTADPAGLAAHIARHDPARVLRDIDAKRELLKAHAASDMGTWVLGDDDGEPACRTCGDLTTRFPCRTVKLLAAVYSDRPGYLDSWRP